MTRLTISLAAALTAVLCWQPGSQGLATPQPRAPRLIVLIAVDQMRADYLLAYSERFTGGLRRLMNDGAWFTRAGYPYMNTVTCPGHSTIGTGSFPYRHGMILNSWFDRETGDTTACTDDPAMTEISYGGLKPVLGDSGHRMLVPALGEQVKQHGGRAVAMSLKARSAIGL